MAANMVSTA